jgi:S-DNA-T family DNA segregation ATPase FtsK/SpoIIIE
VKYSFLSNFFFELVPSIVKALLFLSFALFLAVALFTHNPSDNSFNVASSHNISNDAGIIGAYIADPLLQFFGLASILLVILPLIWGLKLLCGRKLTSIFLSITTASLCLISSSIIFAYFATPEFWMYHSLGGVCGDLIFQKLELLAKYKPIVLAAALPVSTLFFILSLGITSQEWQKIADIIKTIFRYIIRIYNIICFVILYVPRLLYKQKASPEIEQEDYFDNNFPGDDISQHSANITVKATKSALTKPPAKMSKTSIFQLPSPQLLNLVKNQKNIINSNQLKDNAKELEKVLEDFGIYGQISNIYPGPVVTLYEFEPAAGTKSSRVIGLADDIARSMSATATRIAVIPGKNALGIELPNMIREIIYLREVIEKNAYQDPHNKLPIILGKDIAGQEVVVDLSRMPHLLVAGTTGSGKSVAINTMILSLLYKLTPEQCRFIMIDPKMLELSVYDGIPHLLAPVVTEPGKAITALKWVVKEMESRYRLMSNLSVRNIAGYNHKLLEAKANGEVLERTVQTGFDPHTGQPIMEKIPFSMEILPFIVVIVDEMADLMLVAGKDIETSVQRLAQMARAAGIHIIMATQRPSVDVITGVIKANFPTRISFQVTSRIDSRTILGEQGAEQLLGMGDMLYMAGGGQVVRVHGPFVDDAEVEKVVSFLKSQSSPDYIDAVTSESDEMSPGENGVYEQDDVYDKAVAIVAHEQKASTSFIQRCLKIGYNRAASIIERMEKEGIVSSANHVGKREVLLPPTK